MKSPPKMPQRAMVRIWVASFHQKASTYSSALRLLLCNKAKLMERVDSNRLAQSTCAHQKTATYQNTLRFCFTILCLVVFTSSVCQSSCARILFCTISPAGVRARIRPSKVAYPARTQFCTKASCAVENCLPYRAL